MSTMMLNPAQPQAPHRKPVPGRPSYSNLQQPDQAQPRAPPSPYGSDQQRAYTRTASTSSSVSPQPPANSMYAMPPQHQAQYQARSQRAFSNANSIASSSNGLQRAPTNSSLPRRSTSSRSGSGSSASPTSYVALMRKQKATVWCDRAQHEDPKILAAKRAAKMRAVMEVAGGQHRFSTSSNAQAQSGIRSKIRHHGAPKASAYTGQANLAGAGVPMRLSASEVDDENDSDEEDSKYMNYHQRTGSRNSSMGSGRRNNNSSYLNSSGKLSYSNGSTPQSAQSPSESMEQYEDQTPHANAYNAGDYFARHDGSDESEQQFGQLGGLPPSTAKDHERTTSEDLRRRGSVDERAMTMSGTRLFVANPDLSD